MVLDYTAQREKNIAANKALLESLGLEELKQAGFAPAAIAGPSVSKKEPKAKPPPKPNPKKTSQKRKREDKSEDSQDGDSVDAEYKAPRLDEPESSSDDDRPRRSTRRRAKRINYNEDSLEKMNAKKATQAKQRTRELGEDREGRVGNRLGQRLHDPKTYGSIPGVDVGTVWETRAQCSNDAIHAPFVAGIASGVSGAYSVALSGGYDDDVDLGYAFTYTGSGGRDLKGTKDQPKNLRTAPQSSDQTFDNPFNAALKASTVSKNPVRVIRGYKLKSIYAPKTGYRYDGLYQVLKAWVEPGLNPQGFKVCKFAFKRLENQPPLPERSLDEDEDEDEDDTKAEANDDAAEASEKASPPPPSNTEADD